MLAPGNERKDRQKGNIMNITEKPTNNGLGRLFTDKVVRPLNTVSCANSSDSNAKV